MNSRTNGEDEGDLRSIEHEAGGPLIDAWLKELGGSKSPVGASSTEKMVPIVMLASMLLEPSSGSIATKNASISVPSDRPVMLFRDDGANACAREAIHEGIVREDIERRLRHAVMGRPDRRLELAGQAPAPYEMRERQSGAGDRSKDASKIDRRVDARNASKFWPICGVPVTSSSRRSHGCGGGIRVFACKRKLI